MSQITEMLDLIVTLEQERDEAKVLLKAEQDYSAHLNKRLNKQVEFTHAQAGKIAKYRIIAEQLARAVIEAHNKGATDRCGYCKFYVDEMCESYDDDGPCPDCQCDDCKMARNVLK